MLSNPSFMHSCIFTKYENIWNIKDIIHECMLEEIGSDKNSLIIIINILLEVQIIIVRTLEMCA